MDIENFLDQHENKDLLRFITCGSVDDGKSTLIGRLLYDSKLIFDDQLSALHRDSEKVGTTGGTGEVDYALLLDGLKAEREQGITIDVAYRYFSTPQRKFIIADTPGHEQYTRNMATGASTAGLAVILIDARKGVQVQTRRHAFIVSLLGIRHVVVAVNKMDLVDYSGEVFDEIRREFEEFSTGLDWIEAQYIPLAALKGDNVVTRSPRMPWYEGPALLEYLERVDTLAQDNFVDLRFAVQFVNRPNLDFRGFSGTVLSGVVKRGDRIRVLPSQRESTVREIVTFDGNLDEAFAPQAVTLVLDDEIDISSGDMIVHPDNLPKVAPGFEAMIVWMNERALRPGTPYLLRHAGMTVKARVEEISYRVDVNTLRKSKAGKLDLNEIGRAVVSTTKPVFYDPYSKNRETGNFILIDPVDNATVAAGMIAEAPVTESEFSRDGREFSWDTGLVTSRERMIRNRHKGKAVIVVGGNDGNGVVLAKTLEQELFRRNMLSYYLSPTNLAGGLDADIGGGFADRDEHLRRLGELARIMTDAGMIFISALPDADAVDIERLKRLSSPYELLVVKVGGRADRDGQVDIHIADSAEADDGIGLVFRLLLDHKIIPEYCI